MMAGSMAMVAADNNNGPIKRSRVLAHSLGGRAGLLREIGASHDHSAGFDAWANGLGKRQLWSVHECYQYCAIPPCSTFVHDEVTQIIFAALTTPAIESYSSSLVMLEKSSRYHTYSLKREEEFEEYMVTSITMSLTGTILVITGDGSQPSTLCPFYLNGLGEDHPTVRGELFKPDDICWACAALPSTEYCTFAVAASNGSFIFYPDEDEWTMESMCAKPEEAVAVDWQGEDVILRGSRDGAVKLWDTRTEAESSEPRIQYHTPINHLKCIDENLVVVAGLHNQLCTYDLRYAKPPSAKYATQYYDRFPTYRNNMLDHLSVGLDVHRNLVAAATDDGRVQIFDVKRGVELASNISNLGANATCVKFVDEQASGNALKLFVTAGISIDGWAFEGSEDRRVNDIDDVYYCQEPPESDSPSNSARSMSPI